MLSFAVKNLTNELSKAGLNYRTYVDLAPIVSYTNSPQKTVSDSMDMPSTN